MEHYTHSLGRLGRGVVDVKSGNLMLFCNDTATVGRVFNAKDCKVQTPFGRGWELKLEGEKGSNLEYTNGKLTKFTDKSGTEYRFLYSNGLLSCISYDGGLLFYEYNADGMLTRVTYPDGQKAELCYRDVFYLYDVNVTGSDGCGKIAVSYADNFYNNRVGCIYEYVYDGRERKEQRFVDISNPQNVITFLHQNQQKR